MIFVGYFYGMLLVLVMSYVKVVILVLVLIFEWWFNKLVDLVINDGLFVFFIGNEDVIDFGFMIV